MNFGTRVSETNSFALLDQYIAAGGQFLDTANNYAFWNEGGKGGESEALLGRWMRERRNRNEITLATKVGAMPTVPGGGLKSAEGLGAAAIARAIDASLQRLGTDYIDLYYAHIDYRAAPLEETLAAFDALVQAGKVRAIACSNMTAWRIERARGTSERNGWAAYCGVQQRYSYLRPKVGADLGVQLSASDELLDYCATHRDFTLLAYSPLLGGAYTRRDTPLPAEYVGPDSEARLAALATVTAELGVSANQVVLAWLRQSGPTAVPLIAASHPAQLLESLGALDVVLSDAQLTTLDNAAA